MWVFGVLLGAWLGGRCRDDAGRGRRLLCSCAVSVVRRPRDRGSTRAHSARHAHPAHRNPRDFPSHQSHKQKSRQREGPSATKGARRHKKHGETPDGSAGARHGGECAAAMRATKALTAPGGARHPPHRRARDRARADARVLQPPSPRRRVLRPPSSHRVLRCPVQPPPTPHSHPPDFAGQRVLQLGGGANRLGGGVSAEYSRMSHCFSLPSLLSENLRNRCSVSAEA